MYVCGFGLICIFRATLDFYPARPILNLSVKKWGLLARNFQKDRTETFPSMLKKVEQWVFVPFTDRKPIFRSPSGAPSISSKLSICVEDILGEESFPVTGCIIGNLIMRAASFSGCLVRAAAAEKCQSP